MEKKNAGKAGIAIAVALILIGASFYGGMAYAKTQTPARGFGAANARFTTGQAGAGGATFSTRGIGGFTAGEIISKDATSITLKMPDGSTKIVLVGDSTKVMKSADGSLDDLTVGTNVTVTGTPNSDKSVTAASVQIRPAGQFVTQAR